MSKFYNLVASWCRLFADWLAPVADTQESWVAIAYALVLKAEQFSAGTSGEYKRQWVFARLIKQFPDVAKHLLALTVEVAVGRMKRDE